MFLFLFFFLVLVYVFVFVFVFLFFVFVFVFLFFFSLALLGVNFVVNALLFPTKSTKISLLTYFFCPFFFLLHGLCSFLDFKELEIECHSRLSKKSFVGFYIVAA